jgi:hypothetical protein
MMEVKNVEDVQEFLKHRLGLRKCLEISEEEFVGAGRRKGVKKA